MMILVLLYTDELEKQICIMVLFVSMLLQLTQLIFGS